MNHAYDMDCEPSEELRPFINSINVDVVLKLQKDLDPYDITSLVFLLYEVPDTALQRLLVYQKVSKDIEYDNMNLLYNWASHAHNKATWKNEFLEALCICRCYNVIRKLGCCITAVKNYYKPADLTLSVHIPLVKKVLYRICESITSENLFKLKKTLLSLDVDTSEYESCELILLELQCRKFITFQTHNNNGNQYKTNLKSFSDILNHFPDLVTYVNYLNELENGKNCVDNVNQSYSSQNFPSSSKIILSQPEWNNTKENHEESNTYDDIFKEFNQMNLDDIPTELKSDNVLLLKDAYVIKNPKRIGVCCIINQEIFYPSKENIQKKIHINLSTRLGSTLDQIALETTMASLNFEVKVGKNLNHKEMIDFIKNILKHNVCEDDSVFILCILSHGIRGHVYAADSVKVKIEDIQLLLDSDTAKALYGKPKVLILQACQVDEEPIISQGLVADGPTNYFLRKSDFLIYWATAPEFKAYRHEEKGSVFIQLLCRAIKAMAKREHIYDIFTKVTKFVTQVCTNVRRLQVPIFESTLRNKLYLVHPSNNAFVNKH